MTDPTRNSGTMTTLSFPHSSDIKTVESILNNSSTATSPALTLDLASVEFLDLAAAVHVLAVLVLRRRLTLGTTLVIPRDKRVRDYLRLWAFPRAVRAVTGHPFTSYVDDDGRRYFGENTHGASRSYYGVAGGPIEDDKAYERLLYSNFFSMSVFPLRLGDPSTPIVLRESGRWEQALVRSVLSRHLNGPDDYIASRVVFEAMTNAIRHPRASFILAASQFQPRTPSSAAGFFTMIYWDDGDSMITTLRRGLVAGSPSSPAPPELQRAYELIVEPAHGPSSVRTISPDFQPSATDSDALLLLSTTMPGVTCDAEGKGHLVHPMLGVHDPRFAAPGMGLALLVNTVVDVFGGSVAFRTGRHFLNIKQHLRRNDTYRAKIRYLGDAAPDFPGNMVTVRVPLGHA